jgi:glyoxylase-like metal-dependent hydrolase (beta-lactamase superfamily II)
MERTRVGDVEIVALLDLTGGPPAEQIYASAGAGLDRYREHIDAEGRFAINFSAFLLRADGRTVLVDTGGGPERDSALMRELGAAGVAPGDVDVVVFTHLHWDHTGWNIDRDTGRPTFPRARYLVPKIDWDLLSGRDPRPPRTFSRDVAPLEALGALELIDGERAVTPSITTFPAPGHTLGHTALVVSSQGERAYVLGDAFISAIDIAEPTWATTWDDDHEATVRTRRALVERIDGTGDVLAISHPVPSLGRFVTVDGRRRWRGL